MQVIPEGRRNLILAVAGAVFAAALVLGILTGRAGRPDDAPEPPVPPPLVLDVAEPAADSLIGLVEIPGIFNLPDSAAAARRPVTVYERTGFDLRPAAVLRDPVGFETREYGYEEAGAVVYANPEGWYRIGLADGRHVWLPARDAGPFHSVDTMLTDGLTYLTSAWDGQLWSEPDTALTPVRSPFWRAGAKDYSADVRQTRRVGGRLWLQVALLSRSPCETGFADVAAEGWVPAYNAKRELIAWFYSRGC
jgi:hypothetical protein